MSRNKEPQKVFIGLCDIASQISIFADGFHKNGFKTFTAKESEGFNQNSIVDINCDDHPLPEFLKSIRPSILSVYLRKKLSIQEKVWKKAVKECDIFLLMFYSFQPQLKKIKELKKKEKKS